MNEQRTFEVTGTEMSPTFSSYADLNRYVEKADRLRAEATAEMLVATWRGMARALDPLRERLAHLRQQRQTYDALMGCSDRVLADIGIEREDIPLIARGIDPRAHETTSARWRHWWHALRMRIAAAYQAHREWRRINRELMAYTDRELDEIGIRRSDIPWIARGRPALSAAE